MSQKKIAVMGIGGIGGLMAALLLKKYGEDVSLIARGARGRAIAEKGLTLHSDCFGSFTVPAAHVSAEPADFGVQDLVLICVKNDALRTAVRQIAPIVGPETVVMPIMNGVNVGRVIREELKTGILLESVIYTVASALPDFSVRQQGDFTSILLGDPAETPQGTEAAGQMAALLAAAGIKCKAAADVRAAVWSKYVLNCAFNVVTARCGVLIGEVKADPAKRQAYRSLLEEAYAVGLAQGAALPDNLIEKHMERLDHTSDDSDSSLGRDFRAGRVGEMEVFCGEVVRMAKAAGIEVPVTAEFYAALLEKAAKFNNSLS